MNHKDFEKHERKIKFLRQRRKDIVVGRWIKENVPEFDTHFKMVKPGYGTWIYKSKEYK